MRCSSPSSSIRLLSFAPLPLLPSRLFFPSLCSVSLAHRVLHRRTRSVPTVTSLPYYAPQCVFDKHSALKVPLKGIFFFDGETQ